MSWDELCSENTQLQMIQTTLELGNAGPAHSSWFLLAYSSVTLNIQQIMGCYSTGFWTNGTGLRNGGIGRTHGEESSVKVGKHWLQSRKWAWGLVTAGTAASLRERGVQPLHHDLLKEVISPDSVCLHHEVHLNIRYEEETKWENVYLSTDHGQGDVLDRYFKYRYVYSKHMKLPT